MSHALESKCPNCGKYSGHETHKTYPGHYCWTDELTELLKKSGNKNISFRKRSKWCEGCKNHFTTIEMPRMDLEKIANLLEYYVDKDKNHEEEIQQRDEKIQQLEEENQKFRQRLNAINKSIDELL